MSLACAIFFWAAAASAQTVPGQTVEIGNQVAIVRNVAADPRAADANVSQVASNLWDQPQSIPGMPIRGKFVSHPWKWETDLPDSPSDDIDKIINAAERKFFLDRSRVPQPTILQSLAHMKEMNAAGKIGFESLPTNTAGIYHILEDRVGLSRYMPYIAMKVGDVAAASVLCHEAGGHAEDPNVKGGDVETNEVFAFLRQYDCLKQAYDRGEELGTTRIRLTAELQRHPSFIARLSLDFVSTLDALWGTGGDPAKIKELVNQLYNPDGSPAVPSA